MIPFITLSVKMLLHYRRGVLLYYWLPVLKLLHYQRRITISGNLYYAIMIIGSLLHYWL